MRLSKTALITTLIVIGFAVIAIIAVIRLDLLHQVPDTTQYRSNDYRFVYPVGYDIEEYQDGSSAVGRVTAEGFDTAVAITKVESAESKAATPHPDAQSFFLSQALLQCAADGPSESLSCEAEPVRDITLSSGEQAFEYVLTLVRTDLTTGEKTTSSFGSVFAFPLTPEGTDTAYEGILVYAPLSAVGRGEDVPQEFAVRIANSLETPQ